MKQGSRTWAEKKCPLGRFKVRGGDDSYKFTSLDLGTGLNFLIGHQERVARLLLQLT